MIATTPCIDLAIQREIPSQNRRDRWHWRTRHADRDAWILLLRAAVRSMPQRPMCKVRVTIVSLRHSLIRDDANLRGGAKGLCDALVHLGFIRDDSDEFAHFTYRQYQAPKAMRCTRVVISPEATP